VIRLCRLAIVMLVGWSALVGGSGPAAAASGPVDVPEVTAEDPDDDGVPEPSVSWVAGGPCACRCPILGGGTGLQVAGIKIAVDARTALVVCGTRLALDLDPGPPSSSVLPTAETRLHVNPNGLGRGGPAG
jgi:hypothetical protein